MTGVLPLDKAAALAKMTKPKKRKLIEATCVDCGKKRMIHKGSNFPSRCKACALNRGWGRKP